ncbi:hypothetical protein [Roseibium sp. M-1]
MEEGSATIPAEQSGLRTLRPLERTLASDALIRVSRQTLTSVHVTVKYVGSTVIAFAYDTPTGNKPQKSDNAVHVWPVSANSVPFNSKPEASMGIMGNDPSGDQSIMEDITVGAYVVGYAVGPVAPDNAWSPYLNVVASAYIPPAGTEGDPSGSRTSSIQTQYVGQNTLVFQYTFLDGFDPKAAGAWVGLWPGDVSPYSASPRWYAAIQQSVSTGDAVLNGLQLDAGATYTLALFASGFSEKSKQLNLDRLASFVVFSADT